jgi:hypothetical protein
MEFVCKPESGDIYHWWQAGRSYPDTTRLCLNEYCINRLRINGPVEINDRAFLLVLFRLAIVKNIKTSNAKKKDGR